MRLKGECIRCPLRRREAAHPNLVKRKEKKEGQLEWHNHCFRHFLASTRCLRHCFSRQEQAHARSTEAITPTMAAAFDAAARRLVARMAESTVAPGPDASRAAEPAAAERWEYYFDPPPGTEKHRRLPVTVSN